MEGVVIEPWSDRDRQALVRMMLGYLQAQRERHAPMLPTLANAETLVRLGLTFAGNGDPTLLARHDGTSIGCILWGNADPPELETAYRVCHTYGSFVEPEYRSQGVGAALRDRAKEMAKAAGYQRVDGDIYVDNAKGLQYFSDMGARVLAIHYDYDLEGAH